MTYAESKPFAAAALLAAAIAIAASMLGRPGAPPLPALPALSAPAPTTVAAPVEGERDPQEDLDQQMLLDPMTHTYQGG